MGPKAHINCGLAIGAGVVLTSPLTYGYWMPHWMPFAGKPLAEAMLGSAAVIAFAVIGAAIIPDGPIVLENIWEKFVLKKPAFFLEQDPKFEFGVWYALKNLSHSIIWPFLAFGAAKLSVDPFVHALWMALFWGLASHWCIDLYTHVDAEFERTDQTMLAPLTTWPFYLRLTAVLDEEHSAEIAAHPAATLPSLRLGVSAPAGDYGRQPLREPRHERAGGSIPKPLPHLHGVPRSHVHHQSSNPSSGSKLARMKDVRPLPLGTGLFFFYTTTSCL
jgi:hypothetical protein